MRHGDEFTAPFTDDLNSTRRTTTPMSSDEKEPFDEGPTTTSTEPTTTWLAPDPADPEFIWHFPNEQPIVISPELCKQGILMRFEELVNQLSTGWKYHVANTEGIKDAWRQFEKFYENVCSYTGALVGPPANVTVQALTNDSVVVQWDFDEGANGGLADGFVVKYIHEPGREEHSSQNMDLWKPQSVMDPKARHLEVGRLTAHKPYAFCVLAIKNSRLGPCSDPPTTIEKIFPTRVVQNLHVQYKTSQSVALHWDFDSTLTHNTNLGFYIKQSGTKTYRTQFLKEETLTAPGFERRISGTERNFLWSNLRPYMNYTFKVGVYSLDDGKVYWPRELTVRTDPTGPPLVDTPTFVESKQLGTAELRIPPATEEHGPISHYWIVIIPGNYSKEDVLNVDPQHLIQATNRWHQNLQPKISAKSAKRRDLRSLDARENSAWETELTADSEVLRFNEELAVLLPTEDSGVDSDFEIDEILQEEAEKSRKRKLPMLGWDDGEEEYPRKTKRVKRIAKRRHRRHDRKPREPIASLSARSLQGVYVTAQLSSIQVENMMRDSKTFTIGDGKEYGGFWNMPLGTDAQYRVMSRAFAVDQSNSRYERPFEYRAPMQEPASKLFTDSMISEPFSSRPAMISRIASRTSNIFFLGPAIALVFIVLIIGMLVAWYLKCSKKGSPARNFSLGNGTLTNRHGSITKIALGSDFAQINGNGNGLYNPTARLNETSKLLNGHANGGADLNGHANGHLNSMNTLNNPYSTAPRNANYHQNDTALFDMYAPNGHQPISMSQNNLHDGAMFTDNIYGHHTLPPHHSMAMSGGFGQPMNQPIPLSDFRSHVDRLKMNGNEGFIKEFESIDTDQHFTWDNSNLEVNKPKNRYANVVAYDHSRVILKTVTRSATGGPRALGLDAVYDEEEEPGSDYINANYINGYFKEKAYIATQGPLPETFADFWRMVWEQESAVIVMLTKLEERSRVKCSQYWPSKGSAMYGHIRVTLVDTNELAHYTIRTMRLEHMAEKQIREIKHAQFTSWPDHGVPDHPTPFLMFLKRVRTLNPHNAGPIITHCSAGVGRTGAYIVVDCMTERIHAENSVDIYGCVKELRAQRMYMVQTDEQYVFIHDAVLDAITSGSTEIPASKFQQHINTHILGQNSSLDREFESLMALQPPNASFHAASMPFNLPKNRSPNQLPYDSNRVQLSRIRDVEGSDYINASWIDSYRKRGQFIAAQAPMRDTVIDFWRMIWECDVGIVVYLNGIPDTVPPHEHDKYAEYWPQTFHMLRYDQYLVESKKFVEYEAYALREFEVTDDVTKETRTIRHIQYLRWPDRDLPETEASFNQYIQLVSQTQQQFGYSGPILVHCTNGAARTGVFIAMSIIIERIAAESVVDVFTTVKMLRAQRPNMVESRRELEFIYMAALDYMSQL
ncbi:unnamed protein product [Bursaphelenchus xylophilus]|uniref:protein-tyrosine-phosphatase n=1 Tax=Bursaphelenchus xylophilus TaxID=6326 RepID=A0A1I7SC94_BURXY|nr:unnamed protein product [Bursaphelenchus xylophilus]CAG9094522.1 unnamed protein product [Bursaphelenchus xylophilus]